MITRCNILATVVCGTAERLVAHARTERLMTYGPHPCGRGGAAGIIYYLLTITIFSHHSESQLIYHSLHALRISKLRESFYYLNGVPRGITRSSCQRRLRCPGAAVSRMGSFPTTTTRTICAKDVGYLARSLFCVCTRAWMWSWCTCDQDPRGKLSGRDCE